jgi:hypothetical protein
VLKYSFYISYNVLTLLRFTSTLSCEERANTPSIYIWSAVLKTGTAHMITMLVIWYLNKSHDLVDRNKFHCYLMYNDVKNCKRARTLGLIEIKENEKKS